MQTQQAVETVNKSSVKCAEYNETHKAEIEVGLVLPQTPCQIVLDSEKQEQLRREAREAQRALEKSILAEFQKLNPTGVALSIEETRSSGSRWSSGYHTGYKLVIGGGYGRDANKKWMTIGDGTKLANSVTAKQFEKAKEKIAEVAAVDAAEKARNSAKQNVEERTRAFIKSNPTFCTMVGQSYFNSGETVFIGSGYNRQARYQTAFLVEENGAIKIGHETFTQAQWVQIYDLRATQAAAMQALKASFKA